MKQIDSEETVNGFLNDARRILTSDSFDIMKNFYFQRLRRQYSANNLYTNESTLLELDYGVQDVVNAIISLTVANYKETIIDNQPDKIKPFYCFIKSIRERQVYIKIKISEVKEKQVFCVSFHFAEFNVSDNELPYRI